MLRSLKVHHQSPKILQVPSRDGRGAQHRAMVHRFVGPSGGIGNSDAEALAARSTAHPRKQHVGLAKSQIAPARRPPACCPTARRPTAHRPTASDRARAPPS